MPTRSAWTLPADHPDAAARSPACVDDVDLALRKWADLNPSMEFRCFVRGGNLRGICQRDVSNFYPFLPSQVEWLEETIAVFWQESVHGAFPGRDYCPTSTSRRGATSNWWFNPWAARRFLCCSSGGARGRAGGGAAGDVR